MPDAVLIAGRIANALDYVGVMGVELFVTAGGLVVNEIAPRVHNSGHWTQDGCAVDQFEQHIRAIAGWPLGDGARHADVVMDEPDRRRCRPHPDAGGRTRHRPPPLRQGRGAAGPQDGPCQPDPAAELTRPTAATSRASGFFVAEIPPGSGAAPRLARPVPRPPHQSPIRPRAAP